MTKTLCEWTEEEIKNNMPQLRERLLPAHYGCKGCARSASEEKHLCDPKLIQAKDEVK